MTIEKFSMMLEHKQDALATALNKVRSMNNTQAIAEVCYADWPIWNDHGTRFLTQKA
jgi:predicted transcriptional regulator